jgi:hypothetical protein
MSGAIRDANRFGTLTEERLAAFERVLGAALPEEYRTFLLRHNGGLPERETFDVPGEDGGERPFHCFFALHDGPWEDSTPEGSAGFPLQAALADFRAEVGRTDALPVGKDWGGSYVCVGLSGEQRGWVLYHDHETGQMVPLAPNLSAFLAALR